MGEERTEDEGLLEARASGRRPLDPEALARAAEAIASADALLVGAGAGMGVDSGLPDFRGDQGFWKAYPPYAHLGVGFAAMANPKWFRDDPAFAWGFYGHRRNLYRATTPHEGFTILRRWGEARAGGSFVFTSNVDGQFHRAGFDPERIDECHGAIDHDQCLADCGHPIYPASPEPIEVDETTMRAAEPLPSCPACGGLGRPNILMFGDWGWNEARQSQQASRFWAWTRGLEGRRIAVVELGAGTAIPTVRSTCESIASRGENTLIRINPREPWIPASIPNGISLPGGARATLEAIDALMR